jgi:hypothetical protein
VPSNAWLPLISVVIGGLLTLISSLSVEKFRTRATDRRELFVRRRSSLEELERAAVDSHAKFLSAAALMSVLGGKGDRTPASDEENKSDKPVVVESSRTDELLVKVLAESTGKVEILRAIGLAARIGTPGIRNGVADYASAQLDWTKSPSSSEQVLRDMDLKMRDILQLIAVELRQLDESVARRVG